MEDRAERRMGSAEARAGRGGAVRSCHRRPLSPWHEADALASGQGAAPMHFRADQGSAGGSQTLTVRKRPEGGENAIRSRSYSILTTLWPLADGQSLTSASGALICSKVHWRGALSGRQRISFVPWRKRSPVT